MGKIAHLQELVDTKAPRYRLEKLCGTGNFGEVFKCKDVRTDEAVALKLLKKIDSQDVYQMRERVNHKTLKHPHIVKYIKDFPLDDLHCVVMEFMSGGNLYQRVRSRKCESEARARWYFQQIVFGAQYCHMKGIVLRDIKLDNVLLDGNQKIAKLCDFGLSKNCAIRNDNAGTRVGTPMYTAPEIIFPHEGNIDWEKVDVWALGICLFFMVFGHFPFLEDKPNKGALSPQFFVRLLSTPINIPKVQERSGNRTFDISEGCRNLLSSMLDRDPYKRASLDDVISHPWFQEALPIGASDYNSKLLLCEDNS